MNRREALRNVALLMGTAVSATTLGVIVDSCNTPEKKANGALFTAEQQATITELSETIIPTTDTPGAKAAGVGPFIATMLRDCYPEKVQKMFIDGLDNLEARSKKKFSKSFVNILPQDRTAVLQDLVTELKNKKKESAGEEQRQQQGGRRGGLATGKDPNFFQLAKELTMLGYFTSEIGAKQALNYLPIPGRYDGCVDLTPGQKAWAL